jgi:hypothetical protein
MSSADVNYLVTGCEDGSVLKWRVIEKERQLHVDLCWSATNGSLTVAGALIQDVRGMTPSNMQLLRQRGAVDKSESQLRESKKNTTPEVSVVSQQRRSSILPDEQQQGEQKGEHRMASRLNSKLNGKRYHPYRTIA